MHHNHEVNIRGYLLDVVIFAAYAYAMWYFFDVDPGTLAAWYALWAVLDHRNRR